jgi:hypothetical protein
MMFSANTLRFSLVLAAACNAVNYYTVLANSDISSIPASVITGKIGVLPIAATSMTGCDLTLETETETPSTLITAVSDMEAAYNDAAGRPGETSKTNIASGILGPDEGSIEKPLTDGVYTFGYGVTIQDDLYFSGNATSVFIIRMTGNLEQYSNTTMILETNADSDIGDVKAENIFWQVTGNVKVKEHASMAGNLLVKTDVLFMTGSSLQGRVLAQRAVNLENATITEL